MKLPQGTHVSQKTYAIVADGVFTSFDPDAVSAKEVFFLENQSAIVWLDDDICSLCWIHNMRTAHQAKGKFSIIITVSLREVSDELLFSGATFEGAVCST